MTDGPETARQTARRSRSFWLAAIPLIVFLALAGIFMKQLASGGGSSEIPSVLIGKAAPALDLAPLEGLRENGEPVPGLETEMLKGRTSVVNVWASWCVPCRAEHPFIEAIGEDERVQLLGLNYKDNTGNALRFLGQLGNPFDAVGVDPRGKAAIDWGVYGVPETYIVDSDGVIRYKHVGPLDEDSFREKFLPELEEVVSAGGEG